MIRAALRFAMLVLALVAMGGARAQQAANESTVKAVFLYKFAGYVEWPSAAFPAPDTPLVIGVASADDVAGELERLVPGRNVNGHPVSVRRVRDENVRGVHVLFVGRAAGNAQAMVRAGQQQGALVVTETEKGLELGSAINFVPVEDRIGFDVSLDSAEKAGLRISARMLPVARKVVPRP